MKDYEKIIAKIARGGRKHNGALYLKNDSLKAMPLNDYIEYRSLIKLKSDKMLLIDPTAENQHKINPLDICECTPNEQHANNVCKLMIEVSKTINVTITEDELKTVSDLLMDSYFKEQPHTIKSLYMAIEEIDHDRYINVLRTLNTFI